MFGTATLGMCVYVGVYFFKITIIVMVIVQEAFFLTGTHLDIVSAHGHNAAIVSRLCCHCFKLFCCIIENTNRSEVLALAVVGLLVDRCTCNVENVLCVRMCTMYSSLVPSPSFFTCRKVCCALHTGKKESPGIHCLHIIMLDFHGIP